MAQRPGADWNPSIPDGGLVASSQAAPSLFPHLKKGASSALPRVGVRTPGIQAHPVLGPGPGTQRAPSKLLSGSQVREQLSRI